MRKRLIAMLLVISTVLGLSTMQVSLAMDTPDTNADGTGHYGGQNGGSMSDTQVGYRIYFIDSQNNIVSNVIDFTYTDPAVKIKYNDKNIANGTGVIAISTKFEPFRYKTSLNTPVAGYKYRLMHDIEADAGFKGTWIRPLYYTGSSWKGQGADLREWFVRNLAVVETVRYKSSSNSTNTYKNNSTSNKTSGSSKGNTNTAVSGNSTRMEIGHNLRTSVYTIFNNIRASGRYSRQYAIGVAYKRAEEMYQHFRASGQFSQEDLKYFSAVITELVDEFDKTADWEYNSYGSTEVVDKVDKLDEFRGKDNGQKGQIKDPMERVQDIIDWSNAGKKRGGKKNLPPMQAGEYRGIADNSFIQIAYADDTEKIDPNTLNLVKLVNYKKDGKFIFEFTGGIKLEVTDSGDESVADTLSANNLTVIVEPIFWFKPARAIGGGKYSEYKFWFYGTPTNYAQFINTGTYNDGGVNSWYFKSINKTGSICLFLPQDLKTEGAVVKGVSASDIPVYNPTLARNDLGYAMHAYYFMGKRGIPGTGTYDPPYEKEPHPAPNQSPENIPLGDAELPDPGNPENPENEPGYLTVTRTNHIIKVYDYKDLAGNVNHIVTTARDNCLGTISLQHEPEYKVVEYFTAPDFYGYLDGCSLTSNTTWEELVDAVTPKTDNEDFDFEAVRNKKAGETEKKVEIGVVCSCDEPSTQCTDECQLSETEKHGTHYHDTALYVRLMRVDQPPETHTWDNETYPDGDPGPAPEPPEQVEIPGYSEDEVNKGFPMNINIVKVYREKDLSTNNIEHKGTYVRVENPQTITVEDEPEYRLIEYYTSEDYINPNFNTTWEEVKGGARVTGESGTSESKITVEEPETTLYVLLEKEVKTQAPASNNPLEEDLTESQLTKASRTNNENQGWAGYTFSARMPMIAKTRGGCHCVLCGCLECSGGCYCYLHRSNGDHVIWATFGLIAHDKHETTVYNPNAHSDFADTMYGKGGTKASEITFREDNLGDAEKSWQLNSDGNSNTGIEYLTTISRASVGDKLNLAKYKESVMDKTSYSRVNTIFPASNTPTGKRLSNGVLNETIGYTIGHLKVDNYAEAKCSKKTHSDGGTYTQFDKTELALRGDFRVLTYGGKADKTANTVPTEMKEFFVQYADGTSSNSRLFIGNQTNGANLQFYPYIKMSYMVTQDNLSFPGYNADPSTSNSRTVYMLSDKKSLIQPTNTVEVSWYNKTQADGGYGLQMTSQQWSVHNKATQGSDGWQGKNQVLPGGALYSLETTGTESYIKTITYNTLVEADSRKWITVSDPTKFTTSSIIKSTQDYLNEAKRVIENYRVVEWVNTNINLDAAWKNPSTAVKIAGGGEPLTNLNLNTKANTDAKYVLFNGTDNNEKGATEADLDILRENYQTTVYRGFTDVKGNVYISQISVNTDLKMLDQSTLDSIVYQLNQVNGTSLVKSSIPSLPSNMTYAITQIGTKDQTLSTIIDNLKNSATYNYLYQLDLKTKFITNLINSVERNTGDDALNATWMNDGKWYNEAFDGYYEVVQTAVFKMGLGVPSRRVSILDPNLCPAKSSTGNIYTKAHLSQFCIDLKSTIAQNEEDGYVATYEGQKVYLPNLDTMFYTRPFYIPNANVQDLT